MISWIRRLIGCAVFAALVFLPALPLPAALPTPVQQGKTLYEKGRIGEALKLFEKIGDDPEALYYSFRIYIEDLRDTPSAKATAERLLASHPKSVQAQRVLNIAQSWIAPAPPPAASTVPARAAPAPPAGPTPSARPVEDAKKPAPPPSAISEPKVEKGVDAGRSAAIKTEKKPLDEKPPSTPPRDTAAAPVSPPVRAPAPVKAAPAPGPKVDVPPKADTSSKIPEAPAARQDTAREKGPIREKEPAPAKPESVVQVNLTADIKEFLKAVSDLLGENILYDQNVSGQVIMSGPADVPMSELMDLALQVLAMRGFTLVKMDQGWRVSPSSTALRANLPFHTQPSKGMSQELITQIIRVDPRLSLNEFRNVLSSYISPNNNFQVLPKLNLLLLTDTRENIAKVLDLIRRMEDLQGRVLYRLFTLKYGKVQDIKGRIDAMLSGYLSKADYLTIPVVETNQLWVIALPEDIQRVEGLLREMDIDFAYDVQMKVIPLNYAAEEAVAKLVGELLQVGTAKYAADQFKIIPDPRRRAVILSTVSPHIMALVSKLVSEVDQPSVPRAENIHIYKVGNADALKIADKLNTLYKDQTGADRIGIVADEQSNSLIITANAQRFSELESIIQKLDQSKAQVWLEVIVAEASLDKSKSIGIQWLLDKSNIVRGRSLTGAAGILTGVNKGAEGFNIGVAQSASDFGAQFNALMKDEDFNVLSTPHLLVKDNEKAKIAVGDVIPILQNSQVTPTGSVTRTFNFENVGTNLSITPHVNRPRVTLEFTMAIQEVKSVAEIGAPTRTNRDLATTITVESNQTVVLGGIMGKRKSFGRSGVPIISKLPLIGWLFRKDVYADKLTNLLIFITPRIIDTMSDLESISREKKASSPLLEPQASLAVPGKP